MALPEIPAVVGPSATLIGFVGSILLLWARPSFFRYLGSILLPVLVPAIVISSLPLARQFNSTLVLIVGLAVSVIGYCALLLLAVWYVGKTADVSARLRNYNALLESGTREAEAKRQLSAKVAARFQLPEDERRHLVIVQGGITEILESVARPDVIINSENDFMALGRPFDRNFSGTLRNLDAIKDEAQYITVDALQAKLSERLATPWRPVALGTVIETEATGLSKWNVKYVFHVATVRPRLKGGFNTDPNEIPSYIEKCFAKYRDLLREGKPIQTMLFPLIGAGDGGVSAPVSANMMVPTIVQQMASHLGVREIYVVAFREGDLQALLDTARTLNLATA